MVSVTHHIRNSDIMAAVILHDTLHNFTEASAAVLRYLSDEDEGQLADFKAVPVAPVSEFAGDEGVLPSVAEIMAWASGPRGDSVRGADLPKRPVRRRPKP
jgi:hypothetical protein